MPAMRSISSRLTIGNSIVLAVFVVLVAVSVSYSVHQRAETARFDSLKGLIYGILGATEINASAKLSVNPQALPDGRLSSTSSGLFAEIVGNGGDVLWQSESVTQALPPTHMRPIGDWLFESTNTANFENLHRLQASIAWQLDNGEELPFIVHVVDQSDSLARQLKRFDQSLWATLLGSAVLLLIIQWLVLRLSLSPLRDIGEQVAQIEQGQRDSVDSSVPAELGSLTSGLNALLSAERERHAQYRHLLGDLSHSLKTPLSVLQNIADSDPNNGAAIADQTDLMKSSLDRYSQRARIKSPRYLAPSLIAQPFVERIVRSLGKLYDPKSIRFRQTLSDNFTVRIDEADLLEVLGNVLENACRYGASQIVIHDDPVKRQIIFDDNGPGFTQSGEAISHDPNVLLQRGVRADTSAEGSGMGLAASEQIMRNYGGKLNLSHSPEGGARVVVQFA